MMGDTNVRLSRVPPPLVGDEACMVRLGAQIRALAKRNCTVLICGESGTGKELAARHLHAASPRADQPFVTVDCTTLRDTLFESQLFGHVKGAFTGAEHATLGLFRAAAGGTIFFDEIGELRLDMQAKLLRCIQDCEVVPLGAIEPVKVNVRILAATNRDLAAMVRAGTFREDLYFRLDVVRLAAPPLRARAHDIPDLARHFLQTQAAQYAEPVRGISEAALAALAAYDWPGNVRELRNALEHALAFGDAGEITVNDLPKSVRPAPAEPCGSSRNGSRKVVTLAEAERCVIRRALRATSGNQTFAAQMLGIERHRLGRMIQRHGLRDYARAVAV